MLGANKAPTPNTKYSVKREYMPRFDYCSYSNSMATLFWTDENAEKRQKNCVLRITTFPMLALLSCGYN